MEFINHKKTAFAILSAILGPFSLKYCINCKSSGNSSSEFLLLYSILWWIYFILYVFTHTFTLHYIEVIFYWIVFWIAVILISLFIKKIHVISYLNKKYAHDRTKKILMSASNNFFTFWFPIGSLVYFGYGLARTFDLHLIYYILLWWLIWFVIWFFKQSVILFFKNIIESIITSLYSRRKESIINYIIFILIYSCAYSIIFIMSCMKFFSLLIMVGIYINKGIYLNFL